jgi:hypothetical protein
LKNPCADKGKTKKAGTNQVVQHISVRIPWKDNGYTGCVCAEPCHNTACTCLRGIAKDRNEELEKQLAGKPIKGHENQIPGLNEGGCFMSAHSHVELRSHPYKVNWPDSHGHFDETPVEYPPFTLPARPFRWTFKPERNQSAREIVGVYGIDYQTDREPKFQKPDGTPFHDNWIQESENQKAIFDYLYKTLSLKVRSSSPTRNRFHSLRTRAVLSLELDALRKSPANANSNGSPTRNQNKNGQDAAAIGKRCFITPFATTATTDFYSRITN